MLALRMPRWRGRLVTPCRPLGRDDGDMLFPPNSLYSLISRRGTAERIEARGNQFAAQRAVALRRAVQNAARPGGEVPG